MKRQGFVTHSGFTMFELMIVITILGFFYMLTGSLDLSPQTEMEKANRMVVGISNILRTEIRNVLIGKMPKLDGKIASITKLQISTGGIITSYFTGAGEVPLGVSRFITPFYEGDGKYEITEVNWTGSEISTKTSSGYADLMIEPTGITFSGADNSNIFLEITVAYKSRSRKITLDRRTGKITETRN